ncbi:MAG: cell division protein ZapA [Halanaerobacter sp.]
MSKNKSVNKRKNEACMGKAKVKILGEYYTMKSDQSEEYINNIAAFIDQHLSEIKANTSAMPRNRLFLLGLMNLADDLYSMQDKIQKLKGRVNKLETENKELKEEKTELSERYQKLKRKYNEVEDEYNQFLDLIEEKGGLDG